MKIEVFYVADCPFHPAAVRLVREALVAQGISAEIHEILVTDQEMAGKLKFLGSPTIRINGRDVPGDQNETFAMSCRLYPGSTQVGLPPAELIHRAIIEASRGST